MVFVSNFPSFMSIGRKQHNGYQLLTFLLLTVPPSPPPPSCRPRSRCQPQCPRLGWAQWDIPGAGQVREKTFPNTYWLVSSQLRLSTWCCSGQLLGFHRVTYCQDKIAKLKDLVMSPSDFYQEDQQRSLQSPPQIFTQLFNAYYKLHFLIYLLQQPRIWRRQSFSINTIILYRVVDTGQYTRLFIIKENICFN